jgi:hypothetical protein
MTFINMGVRVEGQEIAFHGAPSGALFVAPPEPDRRLKASLEALENIRRETARSGIFALAQPYGQPR